MNLITKVKNSAISLQNGNLKQDSTIFNYLTYTTILTYLIKFAHLTK